MNKQNKKQVKMLKLKRIYLYEQCTVGNIVIILIFNFSFNMLVLS